MTLSSGKFESNKGDFSSLQELLVHGLSARIFGTQALFCPENYGNSKEPADVVWIANRCAILMYMTEGRGSFEKKSKHNLKQLQRWLRKWSLGEILKGQSGSTCYAFKFDDIDHVIGVSIVDGGDSWCEYHLEQVKKSRKHKLSLCATVTGSVMQELVNIGACPRDFIYVMGEIHRSNRRIAPLELIGDIQYRHLLNYLSIVQEFKHYSKDIRIFNESFQHVVGMTEATRSNLEDPMNIASVGGDLKASDVLWLGMAFASLEVNVAAPGEIGIPFEAVYRETDIYVLACSVSTSMRASIFSMEDIFKKMSFDGRPGIFVMAHLDFGRGMPFFLCPIIPRTQVSMLELETLSLLNKTLATR